MARVGFDPSTVNDTAATKTVGQLYEYNGSVYRYVKVADANTANGDVMRYSTTSGSVTNMSQTVGGGTALTDNQMAGVAVGVISSGKYGFILVRGVHTAVKVEAAVAAGDCLKPSTTTAARAVVKSASTHVGGALAITAAAANICTAEVCAV